LYDHFDNTWDIEEKENSKWTSPPLKKRRTTSEKLQYSHEYGYQRRKPKYVAIKKIYVTSSPFRILNELDLLNDLRGADSVCPLITAFRHTDQVVAVLPYFQHTDFRAYFRKMTIPDVQIYFRSLFRALAAVHEQGILHRDIKPTNFLYEPRKRRGVLVDFGLAEREGTDSRACLCIKPPSDRRHRIQNSVAAAAGPSSGYLKNDTRPSRRANRAGTRGFRAPEVLFKCTAQTTKIDIWSAGVILLTILSRRFPFFNSEDDIEAMIEIATIFGQRRMKQAAYLHGVSFETSIPTIGVNGFALGKIILWSTCRTESSHSGEAGKLSPDEEVAVRFLERCLELDPSKRISAAEALEHEFLAEPMTEDEGLDEMHML
jgi:cell division control protein 7